VPKPMRRATQLAPFALLKTALSPLGMKRATARVAANQLLKLLERSDDRSLIRLTKVAEKVARTSHHRAQMQQLRELFENKHPALDLVRRLSTQLHPNCRRSLIEALTVNATWIGSVERKRFRDAHGVQPPTLMVISPTMRCNLDCTGCYAGKYPRQGDHLDLATIDRVINEAKQMGTYFFVISGGEPFVRRDLFELYESHPDCAFQIYTNGTLIDDKVVERLAELGNVGLAISLEGWQEETDARRGEGVYQQVMATMDRLREAGVFFGFSATSTRRNVHVYLQERFIDHMVEKGCLFGWFFMFVPVGKDDDLDLMLTPQQRDQIRSWTMEIRRQKPIFVADFWNDGCLTDGCMAGGQLYLHLNYRGDVEPCVFMHFAQDNIKDIYARGGTLGDALKSDFFCAVRERNRKHKNRLQPCMIVDHNQWLEEAVKQGKAHATHPGAEAIVTTHRDAVRAWSREYAKLADAAWESGEYDWAKKDEQDLWATARTRGDEDVHMWGEEDAAPA